MSVSVLNRFVNFQMLLAISKEPDSAAITANLFRMVSLAKDDPEGCVRITPNRGMTSKELAEVFHCSPESMDRSIEMMKEYGIVTGKDGQYFILSLRKKKGRAASKPLRKTTTETTSETIRENHNYNNYNNYDLYNKNNKKINYAHGTADDPETKGATPPETEPVRNCLPFVPDEYAETDADPGALIPLEKLSGPYRNIVEAWNKLKHKPFTGLYPQVAERVKELLEHYSEEMIVSTIAGISQSPFLLGKNNTPNHWSISFTWLLKRNNFEKLRSGQYHKTAEVAMEQNDPAFPVCPGNPLLAEMARTLGATE